MTKPEDYKLIATLWYSTEDNGNSNAQQIEYTTTPTTVSDDSIRSLYTAPCNPLGFGPLGNEFTISYQTVKTLVNNPYSSITKSSFKETMFVNVPNGSFEACAVYYDNSVNNETTISENIFTVTGGRGIFNDANIALVKYDNKGDIFGYPFTRRVEIFKLKNRHNSEDDDDDKKCNKDCKGRFKDK